MAFVTLKDFLARTGLANPGQFDEWNKAWRLAAANGSHESLLTFICRERGLAEDIFLQQLAQALNWQFLDLPKVNVPAEARIDVRPSPATSHASPRRGEKFHH